MRIKKTLLFRMIIIIIIIISLPVFVILLYYHPQSSKILEQRIITEISTTNAQIQQLVDLELGNVFRVWMSLQSSPYVKPLGQKAKYREKCRICDEIRNQMIQSKVINNIIVSFHNDKLLYTPTGTISKSFFGDKLFRYYQMDQRNLLDLLQRNRTPLIRATELINPIAFQQSNKYIKCISFLFPLPATSKFAYGSLLVLIDEEKLLRSVKTITETQRGTFLITNYDGSFITGSGDFLPEVVTQRLQSIIRSKKDLKENILAIGGEEFFISIIPSKQFDLLYVTMLPATQGMVELKYLWTKTIFMIFTIIIVGVFCFLILLQCNYRPIVSIIELLSRSAQDEFSAILSENNISEIDLIQRAVKDLVNMNAILSCRARESENLLRDLRLQKLITGEWPEWSDLDEMGEELGIPVVNRYFIVGVISFEASKANKNVNLMQILDFLNKIQNDNDNIVGRFLPGLNYSQIFVLISSAYRDIEAIKVYSRQVLRNIKQWQNNLLLKMGIGIFTQNIENLSDSALLAMDTLDYLLSKDWNGESILAYEDMLRETSSFQDYPIDVIYNLKRSILVGNFEQMEAHISRIQDIITSRSTPIYVAKVLFVQTVIVLIDCLKQYKPEYQTERLEEFDVFKNMNRYSIQEMSDRISIYSKELSTVMQTKLAEGSERISIKDVLDYIMRNYLEANFSIKTLADEFGMTVPNMSYFFKQHTGVTFQQYVTNLKMEKAKHLLTQTELSLEAIAKNLCYSNASSFCRAFKKVVGISPREFRSSQYKNASTN
ncbi:MAG: AraC family transcriptional regulator [Thermoanaerobacterium sp.]|nr:AraC family transcriptional regulator [Thermoanaerobacterium sp.]